MQNLAFYRKYRPQDFSSVYGQETITRILKNQIKTGRIGHAYLFSGIRGTGKTSMAKIFARAVNCEHPVDGNPCGECSTCKALSQPTAMDIIEIDAASNRGVDEIRELRETITYPPTFGKYKVYIIDETHMLTKEAFNALLKTLEEPPEHAIFILATTEPAKIPSTILSRCQKYNIRPIADEAISARLKEVCDLENVNIEDSALEEVTKRSGHSMRDALSLLDQCVDLRLPGELITEEDISGFLGLSSKSQILELAKAQISKDGAEILAILNEIRKQGKEDAMLLEDLTDFYKQFIYYKVTKEENPYYGDFFKEYDQDITLDALYKIIDVLIDAHAKLRYNALSQIVTDTALLSLCTLDEQEPPKVQSKVKDATKKVNLSSKKVTVKENIPEESVPVFNEPSFSPVYSEPEPIFENEFIPPEPLFEENEPIPPVTKDTQKNRTSKQESSNKKTKTSKSTSKDTPFELGRFKNKVIKLAHERNQALITTLFESSEFRFNKNGLFILIEDNHRFMFNQDGFQNTVQNIINTAMGRPVKVYVKLKSKYYELFGKKEEKTEQIKTSESSKRKEPIKEPIKVEEPVQSDSSESIEARVKAVIGDMNIPYEVED